MQVGGGGSPCTNRSDPPLSRASGGTSMGGGGVPCTERSRPDPRHPAPSPCNKRVYAYVVCPYKTRTPIQGCLLQSFECL